MFGWLCRATCCSVVSTSMLGASHVEVCISARFAGGGVRFHKVVLLIQYILHKDKTQNTRERYFV